MVRPVEWPLISSPPRFENAYAECGSGTDHCGLGPYLKSSVQEDGEERVIRILCPWGYPPAQLSEASVDHVELIRTPGGTWLWVLTLVAPHV